VAPLHRGDTAEIPLIVEEDEVTDPPPAPIRSPEPPKGATLISTPEEAQDLRRRISIPSADFDVNLEAIEEEEDEIEEISLESEPLPPLRRSVPPSPGPLPPPPRAPVTAPVIAPAPVPTPPRHTALPPRSASPPPIEVEVEGGSSQAEVAVPIELNLEPGTTQVNLSLRLILKIKRAP
ncbi:MAG TPA: hypothetical protein VN375_14350, partial [Vicinamibacteria bacterium]|nr:hypothetical protein [Vicinamibacteria bacterium]